MGKWLQEERKKAEMTQREAAAAARISQPSYCLIEQGKRNPTVETAKRIAKAMGFAWTRFFE